MYTRTLLTALLALPLAAAGAQPQAYTVKLRGHPDAGKSVAVTESGATRVAFGLSLGGKSLKEEKKVQEEDRAYTEKVLDGSDPRPRKFTRTYTRARKGEDGVQTRLSYEGKTVLFELQGDKYKVTAEGADEKDLNDLAKSAGQAEGWERMLPKKAVKVGGTWALDKGAADSLLGLDSIQGLDLSNFKGQGKLTKAYKKDGRQWGTVVFTMKVPLKKLGPVPLAKPMDLQVRATVDAAIDGTSSVGQAKGTARLMGKSEFEQDGRTFVIDVNIEVDFTNAHGANK